MKRFSLFLLAFLPWVGGSCAGNGAGGPGFGRVYEAHWAEGPIVIDGSLTDPSWEQAAWTEDFVDILGDSLPTPRLRTRAKVLWNGEFLFIGAEMEEPHLWATLQDRDAIIYRDDDFEVFLDPDGDGSAYFEIEINTFGTVMDLFLDRPYGEGGSANLDWNLEGLRQTRYAG